MCIVQNLSQPVGPVIWVEHDDDGANLQRAQQPPNTVTLILASDPRHSLPFIEDKRALERWVALTGFSLAALFIGLENRIPSSTARDRSPTGTDLSRLLILLSLSYAALSIFESG